MKLYATVLASVTSTLLLLLLIIAIIPYDITFTPRIQTTDEDMPMTITTKKEFTHNIYRIDISADCLQNNSVGKDWFFDYTTDGENIYSGQKISVPIDLKEFTIDAVITEEDESSDTAEAKIILDLTETEPTATVRMTVTEDGGAYRGNTAVWEITASAEFLEKD